ncbi:hypothetical protein P692DRAFT_20836291 [Suillus brevipes Sb2]|nr:hypothetical protein P692DRAFT_20836291 [Suillus brevipes Sb2]
MCYICVVKHCICDGSKQAKACDIGNSSLDQAESQGIGKSVLGLRRLRMHRAGNAGCVSGASQRLNLFRHCAPHWQRSPGLFSRFAAR